jgi:hypothetical protein
MKLPMATSNVTRRGRWVYLGLATVLTIAVASGIVVFISRPIVENHHREAVAKEQLRLLTHYLGLNLVNSNGTYFFPLELNENAGTDSRSGQWRTVKDLMTDPRTGVRFTYAPTNSLGERIQVDDYRGRMRFILWSEKIGDNRLIILNSLAVYRVDDSHLDFKSQTVNQ